MRRFAISRAAVLAAVLCVSRAYADDAVHVPCGPISEMKDAEKYRRLTHDEFTAARVVFFMAPDTPAELPPGDAAMIREMDDGSASLVFIDGEEACAPVRVMKGGVELLKQIRDGKITHASGRM